MIWPFSSSLPHADKLFLQFFDRWYSAEDRLAKEFPATRPDITNLSACGKDAATVFRLESDEATRQLAQVESALEAARKTWPSLLAVREPIDLEWVRAFDKFYDYKRVRDLIQRSRPEEAGNDYLTVACQFGAVLGHVLRAKVSRLEWLAGRPFWESSLLDPSTTFVIPVFHWSIKKLSGYGLKDGFAEKIEACTNLLHGGAAR